MPRLVHVSGSLGASGSDVVCCRGPGAIIGLREPGGPLLLLLLLLVGDPASTRPVPSTPRSQTPERTPEAGMVQGAAPLVDHGPRWTGFEPGKRLRSDPG